LKLIHRSLLAAGVAALAAADAGAMQNDAVVLVNNDIAVSTTWTANNTYRLEKQIYVLPGATLTIEPGTLIASTTGVGGSLAVTRGAQIIANGTKSAPIIFTSTDDVATWVGGDPKTGTWREAANEWGNLTLMGEGYISENAVAGNVPTPNASNEADMEGLVRGPQFDRYGGGNDDDDSGSVSYVSLRYNGKVIGLNNELNGLALGGIGRETDIHHIDLMNGVDDGVEVWGGTVNLKYLNIWNMGDDSLDIDQGWRGKAQFVLIVQGYSLNASQGSGVGDNCMELDGAEDSDWQPVSTGVIYNATVLGQPLDGDHGAAFRDNGRYQLRNCTFSDVGDEVVRFDNVDGDGGSGYGHNGTLSWAATWTTNWNAVPPHANDPANPALFYKAQSSGKLIEFTDCVFFRNQGANAYTEATARGVFNAANNNVNAGSASAGQPFKFLTRDAQVTKGGKLMVPVKKFDPRPAHDALQSVNVAPTDGFFTPGKFRGAFDPACPNWIYGWTASHAYGFTDMEPLCFEMKLGNNVVANLVVNSNKNKATVVRKSDAAVLCDDAALTVNNTNPLDVDFVCAGQNVHLGPGLSWQVPGLGLSGTLSAVN
jgi:hypothetical protein